MKPIILMVLGAVAAAAVAIIAAQLPFAGAGFEVEGISALQAMLWIGVPLAAGVMMGQVFRHVWAQPSQKVRLGSAIRSIGTSRDAILSILISPIVFFALFQGSKSSLETAQTLALSFENGFFINHVMAAILARAAKTHGVQDQK